MTDTQAVEKYTISIDFWARLKGSKITLPYKLPHSKTELPHSCGNPIRKYEIRPALVNYWSGLARQSGRTSPVVLPGSTRHRQKEEGAESLAAGVAGVLELNSTSPYAIAGKVSEGDMDLTQERIDALLAAPSESLNVEIKRWIDPVSPEGAAKIAKATLALRNRNGGYLIIGLDDSTLSPVTDGRPTDLRTAFHIDILQAIVSKYAAISFEVGVGFAVRNGEEFPVIGVPEGSTVPLACKADLLDSNGAPLLKQNAIYFRTLQANGTPSSAAIKWADWRDLVDICFENREADIGRFLRRHLGSGGLASLADALAAAGTKATSLRERAAEALTVGDRRREQLIDTIPRDQSEAAAALGSWSVALVFDPPRSAPTDQTFLNTISSANPQLTGWPVWLDSRGFSDRSAAPRMIGGVWQSVIASVGRGWGSHLDVQTMDASGVFYLWRLLQDDLTDKVEPLTKLDPLLVIYRVAEAIVVGLSFARALGQADESRLGFLFRWDKLHGRTLSAWADRMAYFSPGREAFDQQVESFVEVSVGTPTSAIPPTVGDVVAPLMRAFNGFEISQGVVERQVQRLLERNL